MERGWAALYGDDLIDQLRRGRSWRWFLMRVVGLLERDTATANIVMGRGRPGGPERFEAYLRDKAVRARK